MSTPQPQPIPPKPATPPPSRMGLDKVTKGKLEQPLRVMVMGQEGVGKTTFAANAPAPIFLGAEDGSAQLDVVRFPTPERWRDALEAIQTLTMETHQYQTLVVDTVDWLEPLLFQHMIARDSTAQRELSTIEDYGYSKGYNIAIDDWRIFLGALERLRRAKRMHVILLAHSWVKNFKNPEAEDFDRYELTIHPKAGGLLKQWCDDFLFARFETYAKTDKRTKRVRGVSTDARILQTERKAAYDAKNRYGLPDPLPLSWPDYFAAVKAGRSAEPAVIRAEIERKAKGLGAELEKLVLETLAKAGEDASKLAILNNRVNAKLAEKAEKEH